MGQAADQMSGYYSSDDANSDTALSAPDDAGTTSADESTEETEQIRAQIEQTRTNMSGTIDAIQEKLNPEHLKDQAREMVREATVGRVEDMVSNATDTARGFSSGMMDTIRENPVPAALAGIGLAWLFMKRSGGSSGGRQQGQYRGQYRGQYDYYRGADDYRRGGEYPGYYSPSGNNPRNEGSGGIGNIASKAGGVVGSVGQAAGQAASTVGGAAGSAVSTVGDAAGSAVGAVGDVAGSAVGAVGSVASGARDQAGELAQQAQYKAEQATDTFGRMMRENPLAVGAVAIALGAAAGFLVPQTAQEHQLMGEARDNLMDKAQTVVQDTMQKVQQVAEEAKNTVQEQVQQGLTQ